MPKPSRDTAVSVPLPLAVHFALLPSRIPGDTLAPLLYSLINDIPVYLTVSPSHQPHFSILPLLLSLRPPIPPLHLLTSLRLTPADYSLDLDGTAPFVDLWVPFGQARRVCDKLGVSRLFRDDKNGRKGLLSDMAKDAVSWDEGNAIGHNWVPPTSHLPSSSYSLAALLDTAIPGLELIPGERCVFTPIDPGRRENLIAKADASDKSRLRTDGWGPVWEGILRWTVLAWEEFLRYPSTPKHSKSPLHATSNLSFTLHNLLPALSKIGHLNNPPATNFSPSFSDIQSLLQGPLPDQSQSESLLRHIISATRHIIASAMPFARQIEPSPSLTSDQLRQLQTVARVNLGLVESISMLVLSSWCNEHERDRLEKILAGVSMPVPIVLECSRGLSSPETADHKAQKFQTRGRQRSDRGRMAGKGNGWRDDSLEDLRRRRAGSPPTDIDEGPNPSISSSSSGTPSVTNEQPPNGRPTAPLPNGSRRLPAGLRRSSLDRRILANDARSDVRSSGISDEEALTKASDVRDVRTAVETDVLGGVVLYSESKEGWWMYVAVIGSVLIALVMSNL